MKKYRINEDKKPSKLPIVVSNKISQTIKGICDYNINNIDGIAQFMDYVESLKSYISNPVIAFDYLNRYSHFPNGAIRVNDCGYDVSFILKENKKTAQIYVYVFSAEFNVGQFGLKDPKNESFEYKINRIVQEVINEMLYNKKWLLN